MVIRYLECVLIAETFQRWRGKMLECYAPYLFGVCVCVCVGREGG